VRRTTEVSRKIVKISFQLESQTTRVPLPHKILMGKSDNEGINVIVLRLLGYLMFFGEHMLIDTHLHDHNIPFVPDLVRMNYEGHPEFWAECGDCNAKKLNRLAVKVPEAEIWVLRRSPEEAEKIHRSIPKAKLRKGRYHVIGFQPAMIDHLEELLTSRNEIFWMPAEFEPPQIQLDFNGHWIDETFTLLHY